MCRFVMALTLVSMVATTAHASFVVDEFDVTQELTVGSSTTLIFDGPVDIGGGVMRTIGMTITTFGGNGELKINRVLSSQAILRLGSRGLPFDPFSGLAVLQYDYTTPIDLSQFGASGAFRLNIDSNGVGFEARVAVTDAAGELSETLLVPLPPHSSTNPTLDFDFPFGGFVGSADFENISKIELIVTRDVAFGADLKLARFKVIPEPSSLVLFAMAGVLVLARNLRHRRR